MARKDPLVSLTYRCTREAPYGRRPTKEGACVIHSEATRSGNARVCRWCGTHLGSEAEQKERS